MGCLGIIIGFIFGLRTVGFFGGIICAILGGWLQHKFARMERGKSAGGDSQLDRELLFLGTMAAMFAKIAKADGHVDRTEIEEVERAFHRLNLRPARREYCIRVFREAKDNDYSIYDYADRFAQLEVDRDIRVILYDILWDIASADGVLSPEEDNMLRLVVPRLQLPASLYSWQRMRHVHEGTQDGHQYTSQEKGSSLEQAYAMLEVEATASDDAVRRAYREKAKKFHPDMLRARGLSPELLQKANEQMARINAAWDEVKRARGLS